MVNLIWILLVVFSFWFIYMLATDIIKNKKNLENISSVKTGVIGFVVNFLMYWG